MEARSAPIPPRGDTARHRRETHTPLLWRGHGIYPISTGEGCVFVRLHSLKRVMCIPIQYPYTHMASTTPCRALYIGAGTDILPLLLFPTIHEWIYMDSQPRSEWGILPSTTSTTFLPLLHSLLQASKWVQQTSKDADKEPKDALVYQNPITNQRLTYFINTACPEELTEEHRRLFSTADTLVLIGHDPAFLDMLPLRIHLITNLHTTYDRNLPDRMIAFLAAHPDRIASIVQIRETRPYDHWENILPPMEHMSVVSLSTWEELESNLYKQQLYQMT